MSQESHANRNIVVSLDVGTSKAVAFIGELKQDGKLEIIGKAEKPCDGLSNGSVINIKSTKNSVEEVIKQAELLTRVKIESVNVGIVGIHISSRDTEGMVAISSGEVTEDDIDRVISTAKSIALEKDQKILHVIPQEYIIDDQGGIIEPIGMSGVRLETKVHMVTCGSGALQNLKKCIESGGVEVDAFILQPLASSASVLSNEEKELGVAVVDIGAGTTDIAIFVEGSLRYTAVVPVAGQHVTKDISTAFRMPMMGAESIKLEGGCAYTDLANPDTCVQVVDVGGREPRDLGQDILAPIIQARYETLLKSVDEKLEDSGYKKDLCAGVVLTGGGSTIYGLTELASDVLDMYVRLGVPLNVGTVLSDATELKYATGIGLLKYAAENKLNGSQLNQKDMLKVPSDLLGSAKTFVRNLVKKF